jgi:hypothetical protein
MSRVTYWTAAALGVRLASSMKRRLIAPHRLLVLLAVVAFAAAAGAASGEKPSGGPPGHGDKVVGHGSTATQRFHVNAHSGPNGEDPHGHIRLTIPSTGFTASGRVTCLQVLNDGVAFVQGKVDPPEPLSQALIYAVELRLVEGGSGVPGHIASGVFPFPIEPATRCPVPGMPDFLEKGHIKVTDGP